MLLLSLDVHLGSDCPLSLKPEAWYLCPEFLVDVRNLRVCVQASRG
jgi:hypothetical protein